MSLNKHKEAWAAALGEARRQGWAHGAGEASWGARVAGVGGAWAMSWAGSGAAVGGALAYHLGEGVGDGQGAGGAGAGVHEVFFLSPPCPQWARQGCGGEVGRTERRDCESSAPWGPSRLGSTSSGGGVVGGGLLAPPRGRRACSQVWGGFVEPGRCPLSWGPRWAFPWMLGVKQQDLGWELACPDTPF